MMIIGILVKDCNDKLLIATSVDQGNSWTDREITPFKAKIIMLNPVVIASFVF